MELNAKELVKLLLTRKNITQKELAENLSQKTNKKYTQDGLSRKLSKGTITYNEMLNVVNILGYSLEIKENTSD